MYEKTISSVSEYIQLINCIIGHEEETTEVLKKSTGSNSLLETEIYFRGQNKFYHNTLPSLFHYKEIYENETALFNDFLAKDPELFTTAQNNFDRLALMQHHQLPTRLLDLTKNPLVALYFATEKFDCNNGEVSLFTNRFEKENFSKEFGNAHLGLSNELVAAYEPGKLKIKKTPFSDEIEVESSLARLNKDDRQKFTKRLDSFFKKLSKENRKGAKDSIWSSIYKGVPVKKGKHFSSHKHRLAPSYYYFMQKPYTERLYHEIRKDITDFTPKINPLEMFLPKIVSSRIIDERIKNQCGLFMFVPFVSIKKNDFNKLKEETQKRINILRTRDCKGNLIKLIIPGCLKPKIREELARVGITKDFIYPDHSLIANEITDKFKPTKSI